MSLSHIFGIDVSKLTFDVHCQNNGRSAAFSNDTDGFCRFRKWYDRQLPDGTHYGDAMMVMEHTGHYGTALEQWMAAQQLPFHKRSGLEIRKSSGIVRGKTDAADARMIARFAWQRRDELQPTQPKTDTELQLSQLNSLRTKLVTDRAAYKTRLKEMQAALGDSHNQTAATVTLVIMDTLDEQIDLLDKNMQSLIERDAAYYTNYRLACSVKGIGAVTAIHMLLATRNFTAFEDWRHFASWAGVAPFPYRSGSSVRGRTKISPLANRKMKSLLHQAALIAAIHDPELKAYKERKMATGKAKMSVYNAIRAKLVARVFAAVKRGSPWLPAAQQKQILVDSAT